MKRVTLARCHGTFAHDEDTLEIENGTSIKLISARGLTWLPDFTNPIASLASSPLFGISRDPIRRRCEHLHEEGIMKLDKLGVDGVLGFSLLPPISLCAQCDIGKSRFADIKRGSTRDAKPPSAFHTIALDIWGPMSTEDIGGNK